MKKAEEEAAAMKKAEEEAAAKKKAGEGAAAKKKAEEEAAAEKKAEEKAAAKKKAEEEAAAKKKAEDEAAAKKKAEEEAAAKKKAEEEAEARRKAKEAEDIAIANMRDPIQELFLVSIKEYSISGGMENADSSAKAELQAELNRVAKQYGGSDGEDMTEFPKFDFEEPAVDKIDVST